MKKLFHFFLNSTAIFLFAVLAFAPAARAVIAPRGTSTTATVSASTSLTIDKPSGVVAGDVMLVEIAQYVANAANATSTGWTLVKGGTIANTARYGTILYRLADASDASVSSYTFTLNPGSVDLAIGAIMAFSGVDQVNPLDVVGAGFTTANSTTVTGSSITTLSPNAAVIMFAMMAYTAAPAPTWSAWTTATSPGTLAEIADYQAVLGTTRYASVGAAWATKATAGATGNGTATVTPSSRNGGVLIALRAADPSGANIYTFGLPGFPAVITGTSIAMPVPYGTPLTALAPTYTMTGGATCDKDSGGPTTYDFTSSVIYKVTSQNLSFSQNYTVTATVVPVITETDHTANFATGSDGYQANVPTTTANLLAGQFPTLTLSGGAPATPPDGGGGTSLSWSTLTDGSYGLVPASGGGGPGEVAISSNWILTYTFADDYDISSIDVFTGWGDGGRDNPNVTVNYSTDGTTFSTLKTVSFSGTGNSTWGHLDIAGLTPAGLNMKAIQFAFGAQENGYVGYTELAVQGQPSSPQAKILAFGPGAVINHATKTIALTVPYGTPVASLAPTFTLSLGAACDKASGSTHDFTSPVHYFVTNSINTLINDYKVTVTMRGLPTTNTYNLGAQDFGTTILTGTGGLLPWITKGTLPPGSMLTSFSVNARLDSQAPGSDSWADDLTAYVDPYPQGPGTNALLQVGGYNAIGTPVTRVAWGTGQTGPPSPLVATRDVSALNIDLGTAQLSLGNGYSVATWSGTISVMYEVPPATILTFGLPGIPAVINHAAKTIALTVPYGTALATLAPTFTLSSGTCSPASGVAPTPSFAVNNTATYRVIDAIVARTNDYTVTVTVAMVSVVATKSSGLDTTGWTGGGTTLTWNDPAFQVPAQRIDGMLVVMVAGESGATSLNITWNGTPLTLQKGASGSAISFVYALANPAAGTGPLIVTGPGGSRYGVTAIYATRVLGLESSDAINLGGVATLTTGLITPTSGALVVSAGGHTEGSFPIPPPGMTGSTRLMNLTGSGSGGAADYLIAPDSTPLSATYNRAGTGGRVSGVITSFATGVPVPAADILTFTGPYGNAAVITGTNIVLTVPYGTAVTALAPTYTTSYGATCPKASGSTQDFSSPVHYIVSSLAPVITKDYKVTVTVAAAPPVLPVTAGLIVWLKADGVNLNDAAQVRVAGSDVFIQQWNDSSGNSRNATQTDTTLQPQYMVINGKPLLRFPAANDDTGAEMILADLSAQFPSAASLFAAATIGIGTTPDGRYNLFGNRDNDDRWVANSWSESQPGSFRGGRTGFEANKYSSWPQTGSHVFAMESSSSIYRFVIDGMQIGSTGGDYNNGSGRNWTIGDRPGNGQQLNGDIPELLLYNRVLSSAEASLVGAYLAAKYGVTTGYVPPGAPTGLTATPAAGAVNLSWTAAAFATTYNVQRSTSSGSGYAPIGTSTGTTYSDTTGTAGTTYYYVVTAQNGGGTSPISNEASAARLKGTAKNILTFGPDAIITGTAIAWTVPSVAVVTALAPTYTVSPFASGSPASGIPRDFTTPQTYTITAEDNSTQDYTVTVTVSPLPVVSGLIVWLKADAVNTGDTNQVRVVGADTFVKQWNDQSGAGRNAANTTEGDQPMYIASGLNGKPVLRFTGVNDDAGSELKLGDLSASFPTAGSMFAVSTINNDGRYNLFGNRDNDDRWVANTWSESQPGSFRGGRTGFEANKYSNWPQNGSHVFAMESSSSIYRFVIDGTQIGSTGGDYHSGSGQNWTIGDRPGNGQQLNGDIPELILFNRILTTTEANQMGRYLSEKYGLPTTYVVPRAPDLSMGALSGVPATLQIIGGKQPPTDPNGRALVVSAVAQSANATVTTDGSRVVYTANNTYTGTDTFTYTVTNTIGFSATATVTVTVTANGTGFNLISGPVNNGNGTSTINFVGIPGYRYALETTAGLALPIAWTPVVTNTTGPHGQASFTFSTSAGQAYFRTRWVP